MEKKLWNDVVPYSISFLILKWPISILFKSLFLSKGRENMKIVALKKWLVGINPKNLLRFNNLVKLLEMNTLFSININKYLDLKQSNTPNN